MLDIPEISPHLGQYLDGSISGEKLFFNIHKLQNKRGSSRIPDFTPLQMLAQLANYLQASIPAIETDLITLTRKCNNVLLNIRKAFKDELALSICTTALTSQRTSRGGT